jgi:hypothetical protein
MIRANDGCGCGTGEDNSHEFAKMYQKVRERRFEGC